MTKIEHLIITEISETCLIDPLFRRKFGCAAPDTPIHVVALYRVNDWTWLPLSYTHFQRFENVILVGGACSDGNALRALPAGVADQIRDEGGSYLALLRWAFQRYSDQCEAFFGYCGDARAEVVDLQAGFRKAGPPHLLIYTPKPLDPAVEARLIERIATIGPF
ncbi:MAG: hypothetical protein MUE46_14315 [Xanthomonadales bacterium]|nr:hypothetical protein [Xanthomonadales bacterium]